MSEPIKVGDLVVMVRGHECVYCVAGGIPFVVTRFAPRLDKVWHCSKCCQDVAASKDAVNFRGGRPRIPISWLKRIPPLEELDDVKESEELHA
jgi:hypothetical protein